MKEKIDRLYDGDIKETYDFLLELEIDATESSELYNYFDEFINMLSSDKSYVRVRGFRLICAVAKYDTNDKINNSINIILNELDDDVPSCVRQCLSKINLILLYKPELSDTVENKLNKINYLKYKESIGHLIKKDIDNILENI